MFNVVGKTISEYPIILKNREDGLIDVYECDKCKYRTINMPYECPGCIRIKEEKEVEA